MSKNTDQILFPVCQTQAEFDALAPALLERGYTHLPVLREVLADLDTPVSTYLKLSNQPYSYLFESVEGGDKLGRYSIIGVPCETVYKVIGKTLITEHKGEAQSTVEVDDPLAAIRELTEQYRVAPVEGMPDMIGGLVGYFGYETVHYIEPRLAGNAKPDPIQAPDILLMLSTEVLVFDNVLQSLFMVVLADLSEKSSFIRAQSRLNDLGNGLAKGNLYDLYGSSSEPVASVTEQDYQVQFPQPDFEQAVQKCRDYIYEGDIMQVVLSQRVLAPFAGKAFDIYRALRVINPSPYMYHLNLGDFDIVGSSPEILVRLKDNKVTVRPIAGTRKRGATEAKDKAMEEELRHDEKELAEHLMLIDLGRNDVGRIAETGSVELSQKMNIERYSHVMHIVSKVDGQLRPEFDAIDVLKATFPAGTVSGAPKIRAMEIIDELEPVKRGVYSGAIGYIGWNGDMDTAIAIRTAVVKDEMLYMQAGAGIVADSVPELEWKETMNKARAMFKAVEMASDGLHTTIQNTDDISDASAHKQGKASC